MSCAPSRHADQTGVTAGQSPVQTAPARTLVIAARNEPISLASRSPREGQVNPLIPKAMFNAELALLDDRGEARPYLAEALPRLNSDTWRVFPDGRMETTYRLKPNLTWHDGSAFSAEDYVMSWRIFSVPALGLAGQAPFSVIEDVTAPDSRTVIIRWKQLFADVAFTTFNREIPPLPSRVLAQPFAADQGELFANDPYWTRDFVGIGPFKLDRWEPGSFLEAVPFDGHVLGRAKIERIRLAFIADQSTTIANMLAGEMHLTDGSSVGAADAIIFKKDWAPQRGGVILLANQWRGAHFQLRPELATPAAIQDPRVRRALAHAMDKQALNNALYEGEGIVADSMISPTTSYGPLVDRSIAKYPYDPRRSEQLMSDVGFAKGADGTYVSPTAGRFVGDAKTNAGRDNELERDILAGLWRQQGFEFQATLVPLALATDGETRATFPSVFTTSTNLGEGALQQMTSAGIATPENRWRGSNRAAWSNPAFDRLIDQLNDTLDTDQRGQLIAQAARIFTDDLPVITIFFRPLPFIYVSGLHGIVSVPPETNIAWNVYLWEFN
ncbi:MAG: hypothetical protein HW416_1342 [Chloroflexi bacterium]|nr:hypothetical protein [Chloroflexota bacterium]